MAWYDAFTQAIGETSAADWRTFRKTEGLAAGALHLRKNSDTDFVKLQQVYLREGTQDELAPVMTAAVVGRYVYGE